MKELKREQLNKKIEKKKKLEEVKIEKQQKIKNKMS